MYRHQVKLFREGQLSVQECNRRVKIETEQIKEKILNNMLVVATNNDDCTLETDACGRSWGAIMYCDRGIISYSGGTFTESCARSHDMFELELKSMALGIQSNLASIAQCKNLVLKNDNISSVILAGKRDQPKQKITSRTLKYAST